MMFKTTISDRRITHLFSLTIYKSSCRQIRTAEQIMLSCRLSSLQTDSSLKGASGRYNRSYAKDHRNHFRNVEHAVVFSPGIHGGGGPV